MDSGVAVDLRVNLARFRDPLGVSESFRRELAGLWNDPSLADFPQSVRVAERLAQAHADAGDVIGRLETLAQVVARIEARSAASTALPSDSRPPPRVPASIEALRRSRTSALSILSSADAFGRHVRALDAIARLRADAREPLQFATLDRMEEAVRLRLAGGR